MFSVYREITGPGGLPVSFSTCAPVRWNKLTATILLVLFLCCTLLGFRIMPHHCASRYTSILDHRPIVVGETCRLKWQHGRKRHGNATPLRKAFSSVRDNTCSPQRRHAGWLQLKYDKKKMFLYFFFAPLRRVFLAERRQTLPFFFILLFLRVCDRLSHSLFSFVGTLCLRVARLKSLCRLCNPPRW